MAENRYLKLNCNWAESKWVDPLSDGAKLAWIHVMTYVKAYGFNGRAKAKPASIFARHTGITLQSVEELLAAAKVHGALIEEDGSWVLTGWKKHQGDTTNSERQARYRKGRNKHDEVMERDGYRCLACGSEDDLVIDHIVAVSQGGDTTVDNLQCLCRACNIRKGNKCTDYRNALPKNDRGGDHLNNALHGGSNGDSNAKREEKRDKNPKVVTSQPSQGKPASGAATISEDFENAERQRIYDFWHQAAQSPDPLVVGLCNAAFRVAKFKHVAPPSLEHVQRVVDRLRKQAPGDHAIAEEIERFRDYWTAQKHIKGAGHWWLNFGNWCGKCYGRWELAKKRGGLIAVDGGAKTPEEMRREGLERAKAMGAIR